MMFRQLTFDKFEDPPARSQEPEFLEVQAAMERRYPEQAKLLLDVALRLAAERGDRGFTSDEVLAEAGGRDRFPRCLIGSVIGTLRQRHAIHVMGRVKGQSERGKGRWINQFCLNGDALRLEASRLGASPSP